ARNRNVIEPARVERAREPRIGGGRVAPAVHAASLFAGQRAAIRPTAGRGERGGLARPDGGEPVTESVIPEIGPARIESFERSVERLRSAEEVAVERQHLLPHRADDLLRVDVLARRTPG